MSFDNVRALADSVLLEGYVLYPYRASSTKNQFRWTFGVVAPQSWSRGGGCERWRLQMQCPVESGAGGEIDGLLRFLQLDRRRTEIYRDGAYHPVSRLEVGEQLIVPWDEGQLREVELAAPLGRALRADGVEVPFAIPGGQDEQQVREGGRVAGRVVRERCPIQGLVRIRATALSADRPLVRLEVQVENLTAGCAPGAGRDEALRTSMLSTHLLLRARRAQFLSVTDPPRWAAAAASDCDNDGTYPVLAGEPGRGDLVLSAPIILYDHAQLAPESNGDFYDATEIDELLSLRTRTLTDDEKREARATDPRSAAVLDRVDAMPPEMMDRLHGAIRQLEATAPGPTESEPGAEPVLSPGARVRLLEPRGRTDAQDFLVVGCTATVQRVLYDVNGQQFVAVTIDDDPAAELHRWYGRFHYYRPDEVELIAEPRPDPEVTP